MVNPTLTISIDRTGMAGDPGPLVFSGRLDGTQLGITDFTEPAIEPRIAYAAQSRVQDGDESLGFTLQQSILGFEFTTQLAETEQASRLLLATVRAAVQRVEFPVTVTVADADPEVWLCQTGAVRPVAPRTRVDVTRSRPGWSLSMPCFPVREFA